MCVHIHVCVCLHVYMLCVTVLVYACVTFGARQSDLKHTEQDVYMHCVC